MLRSLLLLLGAASAAAGCSQRPVAYMAYPTAGGMAGIDNVVYGTGGPYVPAPAAYAASSPASYAASPYGSPYGYAGAPPAAYAASSPASYAASPYGSPYGYAGAPPAAAEPPYTLDSGDRLRIVVFGQDGLTNSYAVDAGGAIDMPLIGAVAARGLTTDQLSGRIGDKLRNGFIREPHVAVEVEAYRPFFILGEVTQPGQYPYVANMTVETAVAIAGGFTPRASRKTVMLNRNYYGRPVRIAVPLAFPLRPGDTINVQERWF